MPRVARFLVYPGNWKYVFLPDKFQKMPQTQVYTATEEKLAAYAKAIAHPARIFILNFLDDQCACFAGDLSERLPIAASTVSQHLKALKEAGLIRGMINPPTIKYCIDRDNWEEAKALFGAFFHTSVPNSEQDC